MNRAASLFVETAMANLHIALNDGFAGDAVAISLDGREVYNKAGVRTDLRISHADAIEAEAPETGATVEVRARGRSATAQVDPGETPYVAVNIAPDGRLEIRRSAEPFPML
jgi:hypothetical protein